MDSEKPTVPWLVKVAGDFFFVLLSGIAAASLIGGPIHIVGGALDSDWGRVASAVVGLLVGGCFAAIAHSYWSDRRSPRS